MLTGLLSLSEMGMIDLHLPNVLGSEVMGAHHL